MRWSTGTVAVAVLNLAPAERLGPRPRRLQILFGAKPPRARAPGGLLIEWWVWQHRTRLRVTVVLWD